MTARLSRRRFLAGGAALAAATLLPRRAVANGTHLRVGAVLPLAGPSLPVAAGNLSDAAEVARKGLVMSEEEQQRNADLFGNSVTLFLANAPGPEAAANAARRLVAHDGVTALVGGFTEAEAVALSEVAEEERVLFLNIAEPSDALRRDCRRHTFHVEASAAMLLDALAAWFVRAGHRRWHLVHEDDDAGEARLAAARRALTGRHWGARIAGTTAVPRGGRDFGGAVADIAASGPDVVLVLTDWLAQLDFLARYEAEGLDVPVTGFPEAATQTRKFYAEATRAAPSAGAGYRATLWEATLDAYGARELNARFAARWGRPMDAPAWAAYQALKIAFEAAQFGGGTDGATMAAHLSREGTIVDLHKGIGASFRPWDHQLRQPLYLVKLNADAPAGLDVASLRARADLVGELPAIHMPGTDPIERLDQLGDLRPRDTCAP